MNPSIAKVLNSPVVAIQDPKWSTQQLTADFYLQERQAFHGVISSSGYLFNSDSTYNQLPEIHRIFWRKKSNIGYGARGPNLRTEVSFSSSCSPEDKRAFQAILTPTEIEEDRWVPFPEYRYIPLLKAAFELEYHWRIFLNISKAKVKAEQNIQDMIAMRRTTYDLKQYSYA